MELENKDTTFKVQGDPTQFDKDIAYIFGGETWQFTPKERAAHEKRIDNLTKNILAVFSDQDVAGKEATEKANTIGRVLYRVFTGKWPDMARKDG